MATKRIQITANEKKLLNQIYNSTNIEIVIDVFAKKNFILSASQKPIFPPQFAISFASFHFAVCKPFNHFILNAILVMSKQLNGHLCASFAYLNLLFDLAAHLQRNEQRKNVFNYNFYACYLISIFVFSLIFSDHSPSFFAFVY